MTFSNELTPAEAERLAMLAEEAAEIVQECMKILRHGYHSYHPAEPNISNRVRLEREIGNFNCVLQLMAERYDISLAEAENGRVAKKVNLVKFAHHPENRHVDAR